MTGGENMGADEAAGELGRSWARWSRFEVQSPRRAAESLSAPLRMVCAAAQELPRPPQHQQAGHAFGHCSRCSSMV
jgi:hypothetical protein